MSFGTDNQSTPHDGSSPAGEERVFPHGDGEETAAGREAVLVHACCAACSSYVLPHLEERYDVTAYYYNPNIQPEEEYLMRLGETRRVCARFGVPLIEGSYDAEEWQRRIEPYRHLPERSERCWNCYG
ncbi:MAG TPA: hypothetical protein ENO08_04660, partial [Candidatus Eisenbacteria bacterium]|nr:hypothetical protein [Candidatus Eisenbacteria bacterium]